VLHGTYLLGAGMLVFSYLLLECRQGRWRAAFLQGLVALLLVAPVVIYNLVSFAPTSAAEFAESQSILAHFRIPHHAEPERWCDGIALAQVAWILVRRAAELDLPVDWSFSGRREMGRWRPRRVCRSPSDPRIESWKTPWKVTMRCFS
jgi:hypothetical protein